MKKLRQTRKPKLTSVRRKPARLTEDGADILFYERHKREKRFPMDEVLREAHVVPPGQARNRRHPLRTVKA